MSQDAEKHEHTKTVTIYINGTPKEVPMGRLSFDQIIALAFENPPTGDGVQFTVVYSRGHADKPKGTLLEGQSVQVVKEMEIEVTPTNRS